MSLSPKFVLSGILLLGLLSPQWLCAPQGALGVESPSRSLWKTLQKDGEGLYLTHIPGVFSIHAVRIRPGIAYSGTIRDPGGWIHLTRNHDPKREMVLDRLSKDTLRFLIAPSGRHHAVGFSFETSTGCFTLTSTQTPKGQMTRLHLNGYAPPIQKFPVVLCGNGNHVRIEWQGPIPAPRPVMSNLSKRGGSSR